MRKEADSIEEILKEKAANGDKVAQELLQGT